MNKKDFILVSRGRETFVFMDGKIYGDGIHSLEFSHEAGEEPKFKITADSNIFNLHTTDSKSLIEYIRQIIDGEEDVKTEETLQSIGDTLKRIEKILAEQNKPRELVCSLSADNTGWIDKLAEQIGQSQVIGKSLGEKIRDNR